MTNPYSLENNLLGMGEMARLLAENELTDELQNYWREKYVEILKGNLFRINEEILGAFSQLNLENPLTPSGKINLCNHLDDDGALDETMLQNTIETAIRMLDSLIEKIPFNEKSKELVKKNRKLSLELEDFDKYLETTSNSTDAVDYVGGLVSNFAYRASESLAEEKGQCANWGSHSKSLKPKSFEYWYNIYNGEIQNSLDVVQNVSSGDIKISDYEIIPRRNSHLLGFSNTDSWRIWSDREIQAVSVSKEALNHSTIAPKIEEDTKTENVVFEKVANNTDQIEMEAPVLTLLESVFMYQIGELVKVVDPENPSFGKIYQVAELIKPTQYKLIGDSQIESQIWHEDSLKPVDLSEILGKVNNQEDQKVLELEIENLQQNLAKLELDNTKISQDNENLKQDIVELESQNTLLLSKQDELSQEIALKEQVTQETADQTAKLHQEIQKVTLQLEAQKHELLQNHQTLLLENEDLKQGLKENIISQNFEGKLVAENNFVNNCSYGDDCEILEKTELPKIEKNQLKAKAQTQVFTQQAPRRKSSFLSMLSQNNK